MGILSYSDQVFDLLNGFQTIEDVAKLGVPQLAPTSRTNTALALRTARDMLLKDLPQFDAS